MLEYSLGSNSSLFGAAWRSACLYPQDVLGVLTEDGHVHNAPSRLKTKQLQRRGSIFI